MRLFYGFASTQYSVIWGIRVNMYNGRRAFSLRCAVG